MEIRAMDSGQDLGAVSRVYEESWKAAYKGILPQQYLDGLAPGRWVGSLSTPGWRHLLLWDGGQVVGVCAHSPSRFEEWKEDGEIISLYLLPDYGGRGWGRRLLERAAGELTAQGRRAVFLWVLKENWPARRFYHRCGFAPTGDERKDVIGGRAVEEVRYRRPAASGAPGPL